VNSIDVTNPSRVLRGQRYSLIIATKNKRANISRQIKFFSEMADFNPYQVTLVDGSDSKIDALATEKEMNLHFPKNSLYLTTDRGKPTALNMALRKSYKTEFIFFLDDDILPSEFYFSEILNLFTENTNYIGFSPLIVFDPPITKARLKEKNQGKILQNGENVWFNAIVNSSIQPTQWLPGGASAFRAEAIWGLEFNEALENSSLGGYAIGDDVDFSMRAGRLGNLGFAPSVMVTHNDLEPSVRSERWFSQSTGVWKGILSKDHKLNVSATRVIAHEILVRVKSFIRSRDVKKIYFLYSFLLGFRHSRKTCGEANLKISLGKR
jgi:GT2 family glycosyltransferase